MESSGVKSQRRPAPDEGAQLTFDQTVPRDLVHKLAVEEVYLTDSVDLGDNRYLLAAQLPKMHSLFNESDTGFYDALLITEIKRQATVYIAHRYFSVPTSYKFIWRSLDFAIPSLDASAIHPGTGDWILEMTVTDAEFRKDMLASWGASTTIFAEGSEVTTAAVTVACMPMEVYEKLRAKQRRAKNIGDELMRTVAPLGDGVPDELRRQIPPDALGRLDEKNLVLSDLLPDESGHTFTARLLLDLGHPCFFDHRLDHVPGMLLLELYRQAGMAAACRVHGCPALTVHLTAMDTQFLDFAEQELDLLCTAKVGETLDRGGRTVVPVEASLSQAGSAISTAQLEYEMTRS